MSLLCRVLSGEPTQQHLNTLFHWAPTGSQPRNFWLEVGLMQAEPALLLLPDLPPTRVPDA